jgi:hypothetical protein
MGNFLQTHPPITKAPRFYHILFAQHVSTLNWVLSGAFVILIDILVPTVKKMLSIYGPKISINLCGQSGLG